jgi:hypothetical protein
MVALVGRYPGETRDSCRGSAQWLEVEAKWGENGEGSRDWLGCVEMEEGGRGRVRWRGSGGHVQRSVAWLTRRGIEGEGNMDRWASATVQGGGVEFVSKLKFNRIQIKFQFIQTLVDPKRTFPSSKNLK